MDKEENSSLNNSLTTLVDNVAMTTAPASNIEGLLLNNRYSLVTLNRVLLSQLYTEHGIVQTLIDQPVDDAFRSGVDISSKQLDSSEVTDLLSYFEEKGIWEVIKQGIKWARLFGGSGLVINTDQPPNVKLDYNKLNKKSNLEIYAADRWELQWTTQMMNGTNPTVLLDSSDTPYCYYGQTLHKSRVFRIKGKEGPSFIKPRLMGWGMSEVERLVRSINQYLKNQNVVFELLDEAKIDVFKFEGFNSALLTAEGTSLVEKRITSANILKNYLNALAMDNTDDYQQKQMTFSGLGEMLVQIRQGLAADLRMPITKLFGVSSAGFNSGEDDIENYNSMVESEIRAKVKYIIVKVVKLYCMILFGFIPDDLSASFSPLRVLSSEQEQSVKTLQLTRLLELFDRGLITDEELKDAINKANLAIIQL